MPYEKFDAWSVTHELALEVYRITEQWPTSERYQLTSQTRRAAPSVPTNIAEGAAKRRPSRISPILGHRIRIAF
jgi:four helix bundle protein